MDIDRLISETIEERVRNAVPPPNSRQRLLARARQPRIKRALRRLHQRQSVHRPWLMPHYAHEMYPYQTYHFRSISVVISQSTSQLLVLML